MERPAAVPRVQRCRWVCFRPSFTAARCPLRAEQPNSRTAECLNSTNCLRNRPHLLLWLFTVFITGAFVEASLIQNLDETLPPLPQARRHAMLLLAGREEMHVQQRRAPGSCFFVQRAHW